MPSEQYPKIPHPWNILDRLKGAGDAILDAIAPTGATIPPLFRTHSASHAAAIMKREGYTTADVHLPYASRATALVSLAGGNASGTVLEFFLENGADGNNQANSWGNTPLLAAISDTSIRSSLWLIENSKKYGIDLERHDSFPISGDDTSQTLGNTALTLAIAKGSIHSDNQRAHGPSLERVIESLLKNGANTNAKDNNGNTSMHLAILRRDERALQLLEQYGARLDIANKLGQMPKDMLDLPYEEAQAMINRQTGKENTFLSSADWKNAGQQVEAILERISMRNARTQAERAVNKSELPTIQHSDSTITPPSVYRPLGDKPLS